MLLYVSLDVMKVCVVFLEMYVEMLEGWIDGMDVELSALSSFLFVSGGKVSVFLY